MLFERIESEGLSHYSYILGYGGTAAVIAPRRDCEIYVQTAAAHALRIRHIFETHRNEDYVSGSVELAAITGAEIWHADSQWDYRYGTGVQDGQEWRIGPLKLTALLSPGHTPGMMSYLLHDDTGAPWMLFTGDALFAGDVGRVDFMGTDKLEEMASLLYGTIFERFLPLGDGVIVCPAHGPGSVCGSDISNRTWTTIGLERCHNPKLQLVEPFRFVLETAKDHEKAPYFHKMEQLNVEGPPILGRLPVLTPLGPHRFKERMDGCVVVDTRMPDGFGCSHIAGAISIWEEGLPGYAGWFLPYDRPLLLVVDEGREEAVVRALIRMGYDSLEGYLAGGMQGWHEAGLPTAGTGMVEAQEFCALLERHASVHLLDVRSSAELAAGDAMDGARHIHVTQLPAHLNEIPGDKPLYVFCATGRRSTVAASLLQNAGFKNVNVVAGGYTAWKTITCPAGLD
jgi:hydroxyacylglutathione hydrolase